MKILFDTHTFLWFIQGDEALQSHAIEALENIDNELFFSAASYWEICIKVSIGKLKLEGNWKGVIEKTLLTNSITWLEIKKEHMEGIINLPMYHRDPFDRLLISQALWEKCIFCTADRAMAQYGVKIL